MDPQLQLSWGQLRDAISADRNASALTLAVYLLVGGAMAVYVRFLYRQCAKASSDADSVTRVFPLLTLVTIGVITVVKSSMALSLGLVGALSIVRFRAAIKEPEELIYLFLCIGIGLALGAGQPLNALVVVAVATLFVACMHFMSRSQVSQQLMLTISVEATRLFAPDETNVLPILHRMASSLTIQRIDIENERGQVRCVLCDATPQATVRLIAELRRQLSTCDISYVNLNASL